MLFLNFDGVLHPNAVRLERKDKPVLDTHGHCLFENSKALQEVAENFPTLHLILNTWWTYWLGFERCLGWLPTTLSSRVIGSILPHEAQCPTLPHRVLLATEAAKNSDLPALILDHADARYPKHVLHMTLLLDPQVGLADPEAVRALHRLIAHETERAGDDEQRLNVH